MKGSAMEFILSHSEALFTIGMGLAIRLVELSKIKKKYKSIINGLLEDVRLLNRSKDSE